MVDTPVFISGFSALFGESALKSPWIFIKDLPNILQAIVDNLKGDYHISDGIAIHNSATVENGAIIKAPTIISANCRVHAYAYLRGGVYLGIQSVIGPGCEIKQSAVMHHTHIAHFNYIGDSLIGSYVNMEAGAVIANHHNDRTDKNIDVIYNNNRISTGITKFGALVGDHCKIGANAVLSPGVILEPYRVVNRLELIEGDE